MTKHIQVILYYNDEKMEGIKHFENQEKLKEKIAEYNLVTNAKITYKIIAL